MTDSLALGRVPVLVLGSHRSGTSLVTGVLATAGLALGDVLEPGPDNPRGYFEAAAVLAAHEAILDDVGRDWTCPPAWLSTDAVDLEPLRAAVADIAASATGRWGVKDPRAMFLLPAWMQVVPLIQPVGVVRDPAEVAASLMKRNGIRHDDAHAIAAAYTERLAELHRQMAFPIIHFSTDRDALFTRLERIASELDLSWDAAAADELFSADLVHHARSVESEDPSFRYLLEHADDPITSVPVLDAEAVRRALDHVTSAATRALSPHIWSSFRNRVVRLWEAAIELHDTPGSVGLILPEDASIDWHPGEVAPELVAKWVGVPEEAHDVTHVIAPGLLDSTPSLDVGRMLDRVHSFTADDAVLVTDAMLAGIHDRPDTVSWPHLSATSHRGHPPFHHHRIDLEAAVVGSGWRLGKVDVADGRRTILTLVKHRHRIGAGYIPAPEALAKLPQLLAAARQATDEAQQLRTELAGYAGHVENYERQVGEYQARIEAMVGDLEHRDNLVSDLQEELAKTEERLADESAAVADVRGRLAWERDRHRAAVEQLLQDNAGLRHWLQEVRNEVALRNAELAAERRKVEFAARFVPKWLARRVWRRFGSS